MDSPSLEIRLQRATEIINSPIRITWEEFYDNVLKRALRPKYYNGVWLRKYLDHVRKSFYGTWREFFARIFSKIDDANLAAAGDCSAAGCTLYEMIRNNILTYLDISLDGLDGSEWFIRRETIEAYPDRIEISEPKEPVHKRVQKFSDLSIIMQYGGGHYYEGTNLTLYCVGEKRKGTRRARKYISGYGGTIGYYIVKNPRKTRRRRTT